MKQATLRTRGRHVRNVKNEVEASRSEDAIAHGDDQDGVHVGYRG